MNLFTLCNHTKNGITDSTDPQKYRFFTPLLMRIKPSKKHCSSSHTSPCQTKTKSVRRSYSLNHGTTSFVRTISKIPTIHDKPPLALEPHRCSEVICSSMRLATWAPEIIMEPRPGRPGSAAGAMFVFIHFFLFLMLLQAQLHSMYPRTRLLLYVARAKFPY